MDIHQRQKFIFNKLTQNGTIYISNLSKELGVSRETIRKDIYALKSKGLLEVIRGGAKIPPISKTETKYNQRTKLQIDEKMQIANAAVKFLYNGETIFLDYGTTTSKIAYQLKYSNIQNVTVVTSSINVLKYLEYCENIEVIFLGGSLRHSEGSVTGPLAISNVEKIYCDVGFFGCGGIDPDLGVTNHYFSEVEVSKKMMLHCKKKILVADHSKFSLTAPYKTSDIKNFDAIITDSQISTVAVTQMKDLQEKLILAS